MSYPTPPGGPGSANPYGQPPQQAGWQQQQQQWPAQVPPMPAAPSGLPMVPSTPPGGSGGGGRTARTVAGSFLCLLGLVGIAGGGALAAHIYSNSQQSIANREYGEAIWSDEPADRIFPATIGGRDGRLGKLTNPKYANWRRLGISPETSCSKGLNGNTGTAAVSLGCKAVLRATYVDPTGDMVATVALIVLPKGDEAKKQELVEAFDEVKRSQGAVVPFSVKGTLAADWQDRNGAALAQTPGEHMPYAVAVTTGSADGQVAGNLPGDWGDDDFDGSGDREASSAEAQVMVKMFQLHMDDLQLGGAK